MIEDSMLDYYEDEFLGQAVKDFSERRKIRAQSKAETKRLEAQAKLIDAKGTAKADEALAASLNTPDSNKRVYLIIGGVVLFVIVVIVVLLMMKSKKK